MISTIWLKGLIVQIRGSIFMLFTDTDIMTNIIKMLLQTLLLYQFSELTSGRSLQSSEGGC